MLNADDEYVSQFGRDFKGKVLLYGTHENSHVRAEKIQSKGAEGTSSRLWWEIAREHAVLPLVGEHNILNALAAVSVALESGLKLSEAVAALGDPGPSGKTWPGSPHG